MYVYLVVGNTRVLERVEVQQVGGFRRELNILTLNKERVVVLDDGPNQISTHLMYTFVLLNSSFFFVLF